MSLRHAINVFRYEFSRNLRRRGFLFTTFGLPIIAVLIFLIAQQIGQGAAEDAQRELEFDLQSVQTAGYVDRTGIFTEPGALAEPVMVPYADEAAADAALDAGEIDIYYVIPEDYLETGEVGLFVPEFSIGAITDGPMQQLLFSMLAERGIDDVTLLRLLQPASITRETVQFDESGQETDTEGETDDSTLMVVFALIFVFSLFTTSTYLMQTVIEEKESYLIEILISSVRPIELLAGKIAALGVLGVLQVVVYVAAFISATVISGEGGALSNVEVSPQILFVGIIYYVLGYTVFAALFGMVGAISVSLTEGPSIAAIFILPSMLPWFFQGLYYEDPGSAIVTVLSLFPLTAPLGMIMRSVVTDVPLLEYVLGISLLLLTVAAVLWMAARLFRVQTLLAGQMPRLRDLPRLIFGTQ